VAPFGEISGAFLGRQYGSNKAKPFWGWHDNRSLKQKVVAAGQWGLDPAYAMSQNLTYPQPFSLDYTFNPYLGVGKPSVAPLTAGGTAAAAPPRVRTSGSTAEAVAGSNLAGETGVLNVARAPEFNPNATGGELNLRVRVDGEVEIYLQGDAVRYRAVSGRPPTDEGSVYNQPLPQQGLRSFDARKIDGRGEVEVLERPSASNNFTAKLRVDDPRGGDDVYRIQVRWERDATSEHAPTPSGVSRILTKHFELLKGQPAAAEPAAPSAPSLPSPAGEELRSDANNPGRYAAGNRGELKFRARIDGTVILRIQGDRIFAENASGRPVADARFTFSQPVPAVRVGSINLDQQKGRGKVELLERPWEENHFQAVVQISDSKGGDDEYQFILRWEQ
jgi:hypothetical protein